ncbi:TadE family type IV pilus minor pilin [Sinomonas sp. JGH33]|uniref:TadE family type IV pilus minor pilin n=1 Tax=Sinomonas terricola TaxID=3110330 RepID=A0ABU5T2B6_9MICC|nr:TadE family type IV pilus minor pilin [Sinomonas sp. JGH33]MEA5453796.1 TadE family type IV pilus minor pilin [Sinomonas sp. JGH33]
MRPAAGLHRFGHGRVQPGRLRRLRPTLRCGSSAASAEARGAVTAEFAVGIPAVIVLLGVLLTVVAAGVTQLRAEEAVRAAARELARGEPPDVVAATARRVAGDDAAPDVAAEGGSVVVRIRLPVPGPLAMAAGIVAEARAALPLEAGR